ncbi:hypothetical protein RJ640_014724 [Escallonia rubra]|uniref:non-specific serine/threonine protein kinase n=1 Tax=Escallonia rubra TaxID=112253 RepID=A0AA88UV83_9ASTE|nr:hypothetical protein RJ640_014724 [Escallonia rubra]
MEADAVNRHSSSAGNPFNQTSSTDPSAQVIAAVVIVIVVIIKIVILVVVCLKRAEARRSSVGPDSGFMPPTMLKFLGDMEREKTISFTSQQLAIATDNFKHLLGSGGFGSVYKGVFSNGTMVAVKVLNGTSDKRIEEQFKAEVSTLGRTHHVNLVRLYGYCFEKCLRALVYEYMGNGSLDHYLFRENKKLGFEKLHEIAVGTARGIAYLHEDCQHQIIHYDIKPGNVLLDANFCPKVADFGLAKLCHRDNTHIAMTGGRGTPGYAAPELWMPSPVTRKCDVYSFGMLLFEIIGRRRNMDVTLPDSQEWFPTWVWTKFEKGELGDLMSACAIEAKDTEMAERMVKLALCCVQYRPEPRPLMSLVVKMLEGALEVPTPSNPFRFMNAAPSPGFLPLMAWDPSAFDSNSSQTVTGSTFVNGTPIMTKYGICAPSN